MRAWAAALLLSAVVVVASEPLLPHGFANMAVLVSDDITASLSLLKNNATEQILLVAGSDTIDRSNGSSWRAWTAKHGVAKGSLGEVVVDLRSGVVFAEALMALRELLPLTAPDGVLTMVFKPSSMEAPTDASLVDMSARVEVACTPSTRVVSSSSHAIGTRGHPLSWSAWSSHLEHSYTGVRVSDDGPRDKYTPHEALLGRVDGSPVTQMQLLADVLVDQLHVWWMLPPSRPNCVLNSRPAVRASVTASLRAMKWPLGERWLRWFAQAVRSVSMEASALSIQRWSGRRAKPADCGVGLMTYPGSTAVPTRHAFFGLGYSEQARLRGCFSLADVAAQFDSEDEAAAQQP